VRDLHLTHLRAVLIIDDEDVQSVLAMLHHFSGDNQDVGSDADLLPGVDEIALIDEVKPARPEIGDRHASDARLSRTFGTGELFLGKAAHSNGSRRMLFLGFARLALDGVSWIQGGSVEGAVGQEFAAATQSAPSSAPSLGRRSLRELDSASCPDAWVETA
jgi:hypothetical protein